MMAYRLCLCHAHGNSGWALAQSLRLAVQASASPCVRGVSSRAYWCKAGESYFFNRSSLGLASCAPHADAQRRGPRCTRAREGLRGGGLVRHQSQQ